VAEIVYDPLDPAVIQNPYPYYAALRRGAPAYRVESLGFPVLARYADVEAALRNPTLYSSSPYQDFIRAAMELGGDGERTTGETLLGSDPPVHTRLRKIVNRGFSQARVQAVIPKIESIVHELVEEFVVRGEGDFVTSVAAPLPVRVIAEVLGIAPERHRDFRRWSDHIIVATTGVLNDEERHGLTTAFEEMNAYIDDMIARRRRRPTDDLISDLIRAEGSDGAMRPAEVRTFIPLLLIAGNEATSHVIANSMLVLARRPELLRRLRDEPELAPAFVEEALRYDSPVQLVLRRATERAVVAGTVLEAGEIVGLLLGSANRDDRRFAHAESFDLERGGAGHLTFGAGIHFCLGAGLSRLEVAIALRVLARAIDTVEVLDERIDYPTSFLVRGPKSLRMRVRRARSLAALRA
jgi:cytochrome P450